MYIDVRKATQGTGLVDWMAVALCEWGEDKWHALWLQLFSNVSWCQNGVKVKKVSTNTLKMRKASHQGLLKCSFGLDVLSCISVLALSGPTRTI